MLAGFVIAVAIAGVAGAESVQYVDPTTGKVSAAQVFRPFGGTTDPAALRISKKGKLVYDSGLVAAGAVINSGVIDVSGADQLLVLVINSGAAGRVISVSAYDDAGSVLLDTPYAPTVTAATTARYAFGNGVVATGLTGAMSIPLPNKMSFSLAAGGAGNGRIVVWAR